MNQKRILEKIISIHEEITDLQEDINFLVIKGRGICKELKDYEYMDAIEAYYNPLPMQGMQERNNLIANHKFMYTQWK